MQLVLLALLPLICFQWWRDDALPLWNCCITPLGVHEYNEELYPLRMHRIETEHVRVVCERQQVDFFPIVICFSGEAKMPRHVSSLHHDHCCRWIHLLYMQGRVRVTVPQRRRRRLRGRYGGGFGGPPPRKIRIWSALGAILSRPQAH